MVVFYVVWGNYVRLFWWVFCWFAFLLCVSLKVVYFPMGVV